MTALPVTSVESGHRSTLVTVVAWLFLVLSALATLGAVLNIFVFAVTPAATINAAVNRVAQDTAVIHLLPAPYQLIIHHVYLWALIKLVWWAVVLIASIGVLRRKEWARRTFVAVLGIEIVVVIGALFVGLSIVMKLATQLASRSRSGQVPPGMGSGMALAGLLGLAVVGILLWLLFTFRSARVREEFAGTWRAG
jgi:hypothetical protein